MRRFGYIASLTLLLFAAGADAGTYSMTDGTRVTGDPVTFQDAGVVFKQGGDTYSPLIPWGKFTDDALKQLSAAATTPREKALVDLVAEDIPASNPKSADITIKPVATPPRPTGRTGILAIFASTQGWFLLLVLYGANIFAASEVATYRNQPIHKVCGLAAIPIVGVASTIYYLAMPTNELPDSGGVNTRQSAPHLPTFATSPAYTRADEAKAAAPAAPNPQPPPRLSAAPEPPPTMLPPPVIYRRGDFSFNRRFFETKLAAFFRVVLGDAEKDMVIEIKSNRGDFIGKRISRITPTELHLQIFKEDATADVMIPFGEIMEVQVRHKDLA